MNKETNQKLNLEGIERLLNQSMNGVHILFDNVTVAQILHKPTEELDFFNKEKITQIQELFSQLVQLSSGREKQNFLHSLPPEQYEILLRTYFHILDNSLLASNPPRH
ncbi:MAG: hypothetical protein K1X29_05995 [Bdellovibrionales bacterium]|nr:hypothetical protein [Bdellovibrionales bacterium]